MKTRVMNVVFAAPDGEWVEDHWEGGQRALAQFYADLLGWTVVREDWPVVAKNGSALPRLAFGEGPTPDYQPPELGSPDRPQQMHIDMPAPDLDAAEELATKLGATKLQEHDGYRIYADPVGHTFCIYRDNDERGVAGSAAGRVGRIVIDCFSPRALARFYAELLGMTQREDASELTVIGDDDAEVTKLAFQQSVHAAPRWPDPKYPQQMHLDLYAEDAAEAKQRADRLGAIRMRDMGGTCAVFADPAGHPFCLCGPGE
jgi:predicted enzyme related to lactoylglutathione lyase